MAGKSVIQPISDGVADAFQMSGEEDMPPTQPPGDPTGLSESMIHGRRHEMASSIQSTSSYQSRRTSSQAQL